MARARCPGGVGPAVFNLVRAIFPRVLAISRSVCCAAANQRAKKFALNSFGSPVWIRFGLVPRKTPLIGEAGREIQAPS
jgi:hypothetical protein